MLNGKKQIRKKLFPYLCLTIRHFVEMVVIVFWTSVVRKSVTICKYLAKRINVIRLYGVFLLWTKSNAVKTLKIWETNLWLSSKVNKIDVKWHGADLNCMLKSTIDSGLYKNWILFSNLCVWFWPVFTSLCAVWQNLLILKSGNKNTFSEKWVKLHIHVSIIFLLVHKIIC